MRRYFDADKLKEIVDRQYKYCHGYTGTKKDIYREALLAIKSAIHCQSVSKDMQEVIRCKDCRCSSLPAERGEGEVFCESFEWYMPEKGFCSCGERKDEE